MMVDKMIEQVVEQVVLKLNQRQHQVYSVHQPQLAAGLSPQIYLTYGQLTLQQPDLGFMLSLAHCNTHHPAVATVLEAWSYGVELHVSLHSHLLDALPIQQLKSLPLTLSDHLGTPVWLQTQHLVSYADVVVLSNCWLIVHRRTLITALAQEILARQGVRLIRQEQ